MEFIQETRISLRTNLVRYTIGFALLGVIITILFFAGGMGAASDSKAASATVSSSSTASSNSNPFGSLASGDTMFIYGVFNVNQDYTVHANHAITVIVDGSSAELKVFKNRKLKLGVGSSILLLNGGTLASTGNCQSSAEIYFGSVLVANCPGTSSLASFSGINSNGGITGSGSYLPVEWLAVDAQTIGDGQVELSWSTASENNNNYFTIEYSEDGEYWNEGSDVQSKAVNGESNAQLDYNEMHYPSTFVRKLYYRIKQTDFDGNTDYSNVIPVAISEKNPVVISTLGGSQIKVDVQAEYDLQPFRVYSQNATLVIDEVIDHSKTVTLPNPGMYIVEVGEGVDRQRIKHMVY